MWRASALAFAAVYALNLAVPVRATAQLRAVPFVSGLDLPIAFVQDPSNSSIQYVVEQRGRVRVIRNGVLLPTPFLDVSTLIAPGGERGLLGLAFAPHYGATGRLYICYTRAGSGSTEEVGDIVIARYQRSAADPLAADPASRKDLVFAALPYIEHSGFGNHNGGSLVFGPDGYLYIAMGDGGGGNDPTNNAQNPATFLGKILRIDVNVSDGHPAGFVVPPDNPFLDATPIAAFPEIWAFGVRNPWKFSFDDAGGTNALLMADVGQSAREEVNYEPPGAGGRNYGWRNKEGTLDNQGNVFAPALPAYAPLTDPVYEYDHSVGGSIIGGFVYRGTTLRPAYRGRYFFADFVTGRVWSLGLTAGAGATASVSDVTEHTTELGGGGPLGAISSFGRDARGELYIVSYTGSIFRIVDGAPPEDVDLVIFNYNGDAWKDLLVYQRTTGGWSIRLGNASNTFDDGPSGGWAPGWTVLAANFNADSREDLFLYSVATGIWYKVISTSSGFLYFSQGWQPGLTPFIAEFNADGRSDVFVYNHTTGAWFTCISTGNGTAGFDYTAGGWRTGWQVLPADFDGDGRTDFLLYDPITGAFFKAVARAVGIFTYSGGGWAAGWTPVIADLNGDGRDDVFLFNQTTGAWYRATSLGDGTGGFAYSMGGWSPGWHVQPADFDGNAMTDFFLYGASGVWYKAINTGYAFSYFTGGWSQWTTVVSDLNGDGRSDVFLYDAASGVWYQALTTTPDAFRYTTGSFPR